MAALARSVLRYSARHEAAASDSFADHVITGLSGNPKWLSAKYFYDAAGSELFEEITRLPEYYPTRTELSILQRCAGEMSAYIPLSAALVEFGTGSTKKARILIDAAPQLAAYVPVDISAEFLTAEAAAVRRDIPWIAVLPVAADFTRDFDLPAQIRSRPRVGFFPGSTIGNFDLAAFRHRAFYNVAEHRIEMHLESLKQQSVTVAGRSFAFAKGETIHTENSYKYTVESFRALAETAGWRWMATWTDERDYFAVHALKL